MKKKEAKKLLELLESRFPWLAVDDDTQVGGADTIQELCDWHQELKKACTK